MMKIALTGPESSGKTDLAQLLAQELKAHLVPEYARDFLNESHGKYAYEDLERIAKRQLQLISEKPKQKTYTIIDTELIVLKIWSLYKFQRCSPFILEQINQQKIDLYLLCKPDIPWVYDELRENELDRMDLFDWYQAELEAYGFNYLIVEGLGENRLAFALESIRNHSTNNR